MTSHSDFSKIVAEEIEYLEVFVAPPDTPQDTLEDMLEDNPALLILMDKFDLTFS
jgi:hypothetical protein